MGFFFIYGAGRFRVLHKQEQKQAKATSTAYFRKKAPNLCHKNPETFKHSFSHRLAKAHKFQNVPAYC